MIESLQRSFLSTVPSAKSLDNASKETTPFNQIFGGYLRQDVTCLCCKHVSITFQSFMDLLLDIRQASKIEEALHFYFRAERIGGNGGDDGAGMYKCEKCKARVPAKKKSFICRPPAVLCIQLKRFSLMGGKISRPVQLARKLNVTPFVKSDRVSVSGPPDLIYRMVSMITHVGPSPNCGHYTAIGEAVNGQFFQFDDSSVRPIPTEQALNTASYVVFYEMTPASKLAWINQDGGAPATPEPAYRNGEGAASNGYGPRPAAPGQAGKPCTVTSGSLARPNPAYSGGNQPRVIPADGRPNPHGPAAQRKQSPHGSQANSIGVRRPQPATPGQRKSAGGSLVPYQGDSSDSEEDAPGRPNGGGKSNGVSNNSHAASSKSPFVPRAVTMNALKRSEQNGGDSRPPTPASILAANRASTPATAAAAPDHHQQHQQQQQHLLDRPESAASSTCSSNSSSTKASRSGVWKVTEVDQHNHSSVHSDNSTGSTSGSWKVSSTSNPRPVEPPPRNPGGTADVNQQQQYGGRAVVSREPFVPSGYSSTAPSSSASTPERRVKRNSSMEEYEAELDRGRSKKVKKRHQNHHYGSGSSSENSRPSSAAYHNGGGGGGNPFQTYQNRSYSSGGSGNGGSNYHGGGNQPYSTWGGSTSSSNSSGWGGGGSNGHHRDHSYHSSGGGGYGRHQNGGGGAGYRRSQSSSSLYSNGSGSGGGSDYYRDNRNRSKDRFWRGGGGHGGHGGGGYYRDYSSRGYGGRSGHGGGGGRR